MTRGHLKQQTSTNCFTCETGLSTPAGAWPLVPEDQALAWIERAATPWAMARWYQIARVPAQTCTMHCMFTVDFMMQVRSLSMMPANLFLWFLIRTSSFCMHTSAVCVLYCASSDLLGLRILGSAEVKSQGPQSGCIGARGARGGECAECGAERKESQERNEGNQGKRPEGANEGLKHMTGSMSRNMSHYIFRAFLKCRDKRFKSQIWGWTWLNVGADWVFWKGCESQGHQLAVNGVTSVMAWWWRIAVWSYTVDECWWWIAVRHCS